MKNNFLFLFFFLLFCCKPLEQKTVSEKIGVIGTEAMVVSAHPLATQVGYDILKSGGNAYDAAVAVHFTLAVVYPRAGNLGGGGFLVTRTKEGAFFTIDFREKAPKAAYETMYLDEDDQPIKNLSTLGYLAVGVPGSVHGIYTMHQEFGEKSWDEVVAPSIAIAKNGFSLTRAEADKLNQYQTEFSLVNDKDMPFLNDKLWKEGDLIRLPKLAATLTRIQEKGIDGFYKGETATHFEAAMNKNGGIITKDDLASYSAAWRFPVQKKYRNYTITSMPPPSSGGVALLQLIEGIDQNRDQLGNHNDAKTIHLYTELERRVYADRATYLGDSDFYDVPIQQLISPEYNRERNASIDWKQATPSQSIKEGAVDRIESVETTHYSIVDSKRNAVAITTTLNGNYGSKVFINELGMFLNNEMDDFSIKPGVPNMFGLVGGEANKIEAEKRMLSSMTPTIVEKDGSLFMVVGTPGGSTIITSVFQTIMNVIEFEMSMQEAVYAKKVHHQWLPDKIIIEQGALDNVTEQELIRMGHTLDYRDAIGRVDAILVKEDGRLEGAADPRGDDKAMGY